MATTEGRLDAFMEQVTNRLNTMNERISSVERSLNERLNDQRAWLIAHERLAAIEAHLTGIQTRLLGVGAFVGTLMTVYKLW